MTIRVGSIDGVIYGICVAVGADDLFGRIQIIFFFKQKTAYEVIW